MTLDDGTYHDDDHDIGVVGKGNVMAADQCDQRTFVDCRFSAVHLPLRTRSDTDGTRLQNTNVLHSRLSKRNDSVEIVSDEFDSDSKENENVSRFR